MLINEVEEHIGEEWSDGAHRVRIEGIETSPRREGWGSQRRTVNKRLVRVTYLNRDDGSPQAFAGNIRSRRIAARELTEPWSDVVARDERRAAITARKTYVYERLEAHTGWEHTTKAVVGPSITVPLEAAEAIVTKLDGG